MKHPVLTYIVGTLIIAPAVIGLLSDGLLVIALSILYGIAVFISPKYIPMTRKFWRAWHRENFRIINFLQ